MNASTSGEVKLRLDPELASAIDAARRIERSTRTGYIRSALISALRSAGCFPTTASITKASR